jgi:hypothetical protein
MLAFDIQQYSNASTAFWQQGNMTAALEGMTKRKLA